MIMNADVLFFILMGAILDTGSGNQPSSQIIGRQTPTDWDAFLTCSDVLWSYWNIDYVIVIIIEGGFSKNFCEFRVDFLSGRF